MDLFDFFAVKAYICGKVMYLGYILIYGVAPKHALFVVTK